MLRSALLALMFASFLTLGADDDPANGEREEFEGTWVSVKAYKANGKELSPELMKEFDHRMIIDGDKMTNTSKVGRPVSSKIKIDPSKSPKEINWTMREGRPPLLGIYRVKDDTLEIAWAADIENGRPTELTPCPKDSEKKWTYGLYRREKEKK